MSGQAWGVAQKDRVPYHFRDSGIIHIPQKATAPRCNESPRTVFDGQTETPVVQLELLPRGTLPARTARPRSTRHMVWKAANSTSQDGLAQVNRAQGLEGSCQAGDHTGMQELQVSAYTTHENKTFENQLRKKKKSHFCESPTVPSMACFLPSPRKALPVRSLKETWATRDGPLYS